MHEEITPIQEELQLSPAYETFEQIFSKDKKAKIFTLGESAVDPRGNSHDYLFGLESKYKKIFGKKGILPDAGMSFLELPDTINWYGGESTYMEDDPYKNYLRPGDPDEMGWVRDSEARKASEILFSPSTNEIQIEARRRLLSELSNSPDLDELLKLKDESYKLIMGLYALWRERSTVGQSKYSYAEQGTPIDFFHKGYDIITIREGEDDEWHNQGRVIEERNLREEINRAVKLITEGISGSAQLLNHSAIKGFLLEKALSDTSIRISEIPEKLKGIVPFNPKEQVELLLVENEHKEEKEYTFKLEYTDTFVDPAKALRVLMQGLDDKSIDEIEVNDSDSSLEIVEYRDWYNPSEFVKKLEEQIDRDLITTGAVLELARKIRDDGWTSVTSNPEKPFGYKKGFSLDKRKKDQTLNDSTKDTSITILSGANTSGKSYLLNTDFLIRITAQSIGFAPASEANLPLMQNFIKLDRGSSDGFNDLSAFMSEIIKWNQILEISGPNTRLYVDEGFSTTSPDDQAKLLLATAAYIKSLGGSMMLATHNEIVLDISKDLPDASVYHLGIRLDRDGKIVRQFKLRPGSNESFALAVAKRRKLDSDIVAIAEGYHRGEMQILPDTVHPNYPAIERFSDEERERMKKEAISLAHLFPNINTEGIFLSLSNDEEFSIDGFLNLLMPKTKSPYFILFERHLIESDDLMARLILRTGKLSPAEILERQIMFKEMSGVKRSELRRAVEKTGHLDEVYLAIVAYMNEGIGLNPFMRERKEHEIKNEKLPPEKRTKLEFSLFGTGLFEAIAYLNIQKKIAGEGFLQKQLLDDLKALETEIRVQSGGEIDKYKPTLDQKARYNKMALKVSKVNDLVLIAPLVQIPIREISEELEVLKISSKYSSGEEKGIRTQLTEPNNLAFSLLKADEEFSSVRTIIDTFRTTDSVYLHQVASYLEEKSVGYLQVLHGKSEDKSISSLHGLEQYLWDPNIKLPVSTATNQIKALSDFADIIVNKGLVPAVFNDAGEFKVTNGFNIFKDKDKQIVNDISLSPRNNVEILTGPNGSGKTFHEKDAITAALIAHATGFAPADFATMPVFNRIIYLDRVTQRQSMDLSSFAQDLEYWKMALNEMDQNNAVFVAVDEAFSSTSPYYQEALTYAVIAKFLGSPNHQLMISTHNHKLVETVENAFQDKTSVSHFGFSLKNGQIEYTYTKTPGHEASHAIEVARKMGFPEEILQNA